MKKEWTKTSAKNYLQARGVEVTSERIIAKHGYDGLTSCSARDYLINHCGYVQM